MSLEISRLLILAFCVYEQQKDDPRRVRQIVHRIEEATGLQSMMQIVEKAERHQDTSSTLAEMRKNLQTKVL